MKGQILRVLNGRTTSLCFLVKILFAIFTAFSDSQFDFGEYVLLVTNYTPKEFANSFKSPAVNLVPPSVLIRKDIPCLAKIFFSLAITAPDVKEHIEIS